VDYNGHESGENPSVLRNLGRSPADLVGALASFGCCVNDPGEVPSHAPAVDAFGLLTVSRLSIVSSVSSVSSASSVYLSCHPTGRPCS
jgi:hypothetical protein